MNQDEIIIESECRHGTEQRPISRTHLCAVLHCSGARIRKIVNSMRSKGIPILSPPESSGCYRYAQSKEEIQVWLARNRKRILLQLRAHNGVKRNISRFVEPIQEVLQL
jgi:biotin operon repressor